MNKLCPFFNIIFLSLLLITGNAGAQVAFDRSTDSYWENNSGWRIFSYPAEDMCEMTKNPLPEEHFTLAYFPRDKTFGLVFTNANATSLESGSSVRLHVILKKDGQVDQSWGVRNFEISKTEGSVAFSIFLKAPIHTDIAQSESISIFREDSLGKPLAVAFVGLDGSGEATEKLIACAITTAKLKPNDPFLK